MTSPMPSEPRTGPQAYHGGANPPAGGPIVPSEGWTLLACGIGAIYGIQVLLAMIGLGGVLASAVSDVGCIAFFWQYARKRQIGYAGLGFVRVGLRWYVAAVLVGSSAWLINLTIVTALHVPEGPTDLLEGLIAETPLVSTIACIAVLPAFAEEIVFRGVLARSLAAKRPAWQAIVISAGIFGIYHVLPAQAVATFMLGCYLAFFTLRSRSILPSIVIHMLNNTAAIVVSRDSVPGTTKFFADYGAVTVSIAIVMVVGGMALAVTAPREALA